MQLQNKRRLRAESSLQRQSQIAGCSAEVRAVAIDEGCLNKTDSNNDFNALAHAFESSTDVLLPDIGNTPSSSRVCSVVSEQDHKQRLAKKAKAKAAARAAESEVACSLQQKKDAVAKAAARASENEMQCCNQLRRRATVNANARASENDIQRQLRLNKNAETTANARASENDAQRQLQLNRNAEATANVRASETTDDCLNRLGEVIQYKSRIQGIVQLSFVVISLSFDSHLLKLKNNKMSMASLPIFTGDATLWFAQLEAYFCTQCFF
ncbi:Hypothetical predicted protein [Octopus vulgaris]|uniref:STPR domain-containing protein n=1 Tax=Octopus vulgaris TaxID=6645 RepID=A0AA36BL48_OCTVU|nr:Hypothetical predicted protein [Octopus vulgaris]